MGRLYGLFAQQAKPPDIGCTAKRTQSQRSSSCQGPELQAVGPAPQWHSLGDTSNAVCRGPGQKKLPWPRPLTALIPSRQPRHLHELLFLQSPHSSCSLSSGTLEIFLSPKLFSGRGPCTQAIFCFFLRKGTDLEVESLPVVLTSSVEASSCSSHSTSDAVP